MKGDGGAAAAAIVKVTCPRCGDLDLSPDDVEIPLPSLDSPTSYRFACPSCGTINVKPANQRAVDMLAAVGARQVSWDAPVVVELRRSRSFNEDDVAELTRELESPDWLDRLRRVASNH